MLNNYSFSYVDSEGKLKMLGLDNAVKGVIYQNKVFYYLFYGIPKNEDYSFKEFEMKFKDIQQTKIYLLYKEFCSSHLI